MKERGWSHTLMTNYQKKEYAKLRDAGTAPTVRDHTRIAVEALKGSRHVR
jgi:hypothetical protein